MRILFAPISIALGLVSAMLGKRVFNFVWALVAEEEPPSAEDRVVPWPRLVVAGAIQGMIFRLMRIFVDRGLRRMVMSLTGRWPGDQRPDRA